MTIKEYKLICALFAYTRSNAIVDMEREEDGLKSGNQVAYHLDHLLKDIEILVDEEKEEED